LKYDQRLLTLCKRCRWVTVRDVTEKASSLGGKEVGSARIRRDECECRRARAVLRPLTREAVLAVPPQERRMGCERALFGQVNETTWVKQLLHLLWGVPA
jgi:hypothetical protein